MKQTQNIINKIFRHCSRDEYNIISDDIVYLSGQQERSDVLSTAIVRGPNEFHPITDFDRAVQISRVSGDTNLWKKWVNHVLVFAVYNLLRAARRMSGKTSGGAGSFIRRLACFSPPTATGEIVINYSSFRTTWPLNVYTKSAVVRSSRAPCLSFALIHVQT